MRKTYENLRGVFVCVYLRQTSAVHQFNLYREESWGLVGNWMLNTCCVTRAALRAVTNTPHR